MLLGGKPAVNYTIRLDLETSLRVEAHLFERMKENLVKTGSRADSSVSALFRDALTDYLDRYDAKASRPRAVSAPRALKPRKPKAE